MPKRSLIVAAPLLVLAAGAFAQVGPVDTNGDGKITRREYIDAREHRFARLDRNGDGLIRADDFRNVATNPETRTRLAQLLRDADLNRDGAVSRSEFSVTGTPLFDQADANADGFVDRSEVSRLRSALGLPR